jgi:FixJ family two-component response regulator
MRSILSSGERDVARRLAAGDSVEDVAAARDQPVDTIEKHVGRIREKTERAAVTLAESPFTSEVLANLDEGTREALDALDGRPDS